VRGGLLHAQPGHVARDDVVQPLPTVRPDRIAYERIVEQREAAAVPASRGNGALLVAQRGTGVPARPGGARVV